MPRQRLREKNATIFSMQHSFGKERHAAAHQLQALESLLTDERRLNKEQRAAPQEESSRATPIGQSHDQGHGRASEQSLTGECETQVGKIEPDWQSDQSEGTTTRQQRRLGKSALSGSLTVNTRSTQSCAPSLAALESVDNGLEQGQRKRAKRSRRKEGASTGP